MKTHRWLSAILILASMFAIAAFADNDPTLQQIYDAEKSGDLRLAQQMMHQVLSDHPQSAKAHYVAAELFARAGDLPLAREELKTAQAIDPGLGFANAESVRALERELWLAQSMRPQALPAPQPFPWLAVLTAVAIVALIWIVLRRRPVPVSIYPPAAGAAVPAAAAPPGQGVAPGVAPVAAPGVGSGIAGGLATGLAVGAGVVVGENIAQRLMGDEPAGNPPPSAANLPVGDAANSDLGGTDFGVSDPDSWDDNTPADGGDADAGDGDWT
ncbi:MAG: tetratricopeptide repeat protein [Pseudomonadota bacterium]